jgi:hypothetical protein
MVCCIGQTISVALPKNYILAKVLRSLFVIAAMCSVLAAFAQAKEDTVRRKMTIEEIAAKTGEGFSKLSFVDTKAGKPNENTKIYNKYKGRIIDQVIVVILKPYGFDVNNLNKSATKKFQKNANKAHIPTREWVVRDYLQFKENDTFNPRLILDSERLLWEKAIFKNIRFSVLPDTGTRKVDVLVVVQDRFTVNVQTSFKGNSLETSLNFINLFGVPQTLSIGAAAIVNVRNYYSVFGSYTYNNIKRSQVSAQLKGFYQPKRNEVSVGFFRDFFSSETKIAGNYTTRFSNEKLINVSDSGDSLKEFSLTTFNANLWAAYLHPLKVYDNVDSADWRILFSMRVNKTHYFKRPFIISADNIYQYINITNFIVGIGLVRYDYYKDLNVYYLGKPEYLPKGPNTLLTFGYQLNEFYTNRFYLGARFNYGVYFSNFGYWNTEISHGFFFSKKTYNQLHISWHNELFTRPIAIRKSSFRQFIRTWALVGFLRPAGSDFYVLSQQGLRGLYQPVLRGSQLISVNLESDFYFSKKILGFSSAVFFSADFVGTVKGELTNMSNARLQTAVGAGIKLRNVGLGIDYVEIGIYYYPDFHFTNLLPFGISGSTTGERALLANPLLTQDIMRIDY